MPLRPLRALPTGVKAQELRDRCAAFASDVVTFCRKLRSKPEARNIAEQLSDSATAIPANYRAACRARSRREFISKLAIAVEEADETVLPSRPAFRRRDAHRDQVEPGPAVHR